jgi:hypothetical protein
VRIIFFLVEYNFSIDIWIGRWSELLPFLSTCKVARFYWLEITKSMVDIFYFCTLVWRLLGTTNRLNYWRISKIYLVFLGYFSFYTRLQSKSPVIIRLKLLSILCILRRMRLRSLRVFFLLHPSWAK